MSEPWMVAAGILVLSAALILIPRAHGSEGMRLTVKRRLYRLRPKGGRSASTSVADAAVLLDLTAALLSAGVGIEAALSRLASTVPGAKALDRVHHALSAGAGWDQAAELVAEDQELVTFCDHLSFAYATGAPSASMLQAAAEQARAKRHQDAERRAEQLGVKMMLPLGACFLPAFILLGVVPVVISMLPDTLGV